MTAFDSLRSSPQPDGPPPREPLIEVTLEYQHPDNEGKTRWRVPLSITSLAQLINQAEIMSVDDQEGI